MSLTSLDSRVRSPCQHLCKWHNISTATRFFQRQAASFHSDWYAGGSAPGMLNAELGNQNQNCKKGEIQWTITTIPIAKRRTVSRKVVVELQPQRARSFLRKLQKLKRKSPSSAARRWTISTNPVKAPRAPSTRQQRNCIQVESNSPTWPIRPLTESREPRTSLRKRFKPPQTISARRT